MEEFAEGVTDAVLREKLGIALDGKGAFGRFKNVLAHYPAQREEWFAFKNGKMSEEVRRWLNGIEIEPMEETK